MMTGQIVTDFDLEAYFDQALAHTGNGKFHLQLFVLLGSTYSALAMEVTVLSFVVPSAKADFQMTSTDAGLLTAIPMLGMTMGSFFWGALADIGGRKKVLSSSMLMGGVCGLASSVAQYFSVFVILRFFNGFALAGALSLCLPYLGEFHSKENRERILSWMELFWTLGIVGVPCLAWSIIPLEMRFESTYFVYDSWNLFVAASSIPLIILGIWAAYLPESPKFLIERGEFLKALEILKHMYSMNTGDDPAHFETIDIEEKQVSFIDLDQEASPRPKVTFKSTLTKLLLITKSLFLPPYRNRTILVCIISYGMTASYYTLMMWFPELFTRFEHYSKLYPNSTSSVCEVSSVFINEDPKAEIDPNVYINTAIVGVACIPTSLYYPFCVQKVGAKLFMALCLLVAAIVTIGMYFVQTATQNLILSCVFEASISLGVVTFFCALVDLFPTNTRIMATGLAICVGRIGALTGNLIFGLLIDFNCVFPIIGFSLVLFVTGALCMFLPIKRAKKVKKPS